MSSGNTGTAAQVAAHRPPHKHSVTKNAVSLLVIQLANQALPLVTLPIVTRALGANEFGRMNFVFGVIAYATLIADYGFNLSATAAISVQRLDREARSKIFWETISVKALLALSCAAVGAGVLRWTSDSATDWGLYVIGFGVVIAGVLTPSWYYQGVERLPILSLLTFVSRAAAVPATFLLVRDSSDTSLAMGITVAATMSGGVMSLAVLWTRRELVFVLPRVDGLRRALREGWHVFVSTAAISLYTNTNAVLLGVLTNNHAVAMFVAADKVVKASQMLLAPVSQALYPRLSYLMSYDKPEAYALIRRAAWFVGGVAFAMMLGLVGLAPFIIQVLFGEAFAPAARVLQVLAILPIVVALSNLFGVQTMLPLGMKREFSLVLISAGPLNVLLLLVFASRWGELGAAASVVATETFVTLMMGSLLWRRAVPVFGFATVFSWQGKGRR